MLAKGKSLNVKNWTRKFRIRYFMYLNEEKRNEATTTINIDIMNSTDHVFSVFENPDIQIFGSDLIRYPVLNTFDEH